MSEPLQFLSPIHKSSRQIGLYLAGKVESDGLPVVEAHLTSYLRSYGPCPIGEIRRVFGLRGSTLTSMLDRLETRGILARSPSPTDRRSFLVELTDSGRGVAARVNRSVEELERRIRAEIDEQDLKGFNAVMSAIARVTGVQVREERT
jgi:DNA-binding MarR family transcriptional regulator